MRRIGEELRKTGRMFAMNPAMFFVAILIVGMAVSTVVGCCGQNDSALSGSWRASRALHLSRSNAVWRGTRMDGAILRLLAYPRPLRKAKAAEKPATPRINPASTGPASASTPAQTSCAGLSDLRFPEFNLLIPPL
jgi:hypothetical protein